MIKHINHERIYTFFGVSLLYAVPVVYILLNNLNKLLTKPANINLQIDYGAILVFAFLTIFTNFMLHMVMESNFEVSNGENYFNYKTLFKKKQKVYYKDIKKIVICKENLIVHGTFETIIVVRKGFKRSLFFQEFSMSEEGYRTLKNIILSDKRVPVKRCEKSSTKPLASLFYY